VTKKPIISKTKRLRARIDAERNPGRRGALETEWNALQARKSRDYPLGGADKPATFAEALQVRQRQQVVPGMVQVLVDTVEAIVTSEAANKRLLLEQTFQEFTAAVMPELGPN
jgi:hypothetical protein